ncbi:MAG: DUF4159 domain-containing protein [Planctomycetota bacterium]
MNSAMWSLWNGRPTRARSTATALGVRGVALSWLAVVLLAQTGDAQPPPRRATSPNAANGPSLNGPASPTRLATFFMGRVRYSQNDGNDCSGVGENLTKLLAQVSTIAVERERTVRLLDDELFTTPFLFMNGHNDFRLSPEEQENLRTYFEHGGFLFSSGCCTNPGFPAAWRRELSQLFPQATVRKLSYDHPIYRAFYKQQRIGCLHEARDIFLEGLVHEGRLVAVLCEDGLCCAFSMANRCNAGKGVSPEDGRKLALNIAVYALTH